MEKENVEDFENVMVLLGDALGVLDGVCDLDSGDSVLEGDGECDVDGVTLREGERVGVTGIDGVLD
jgi:hypothetical protein